MKLRLHLQNTLTRQEATIEELRKENQRLRNELRSPKSAINSLEPLGLSLAQTGVENMQDTSTDSDDSESIDLEEDLPGTPVATNVSKDHALAMSQHYKFQQGKKPLAPEKQHTPTPNEAQQLLEGVIVCGIPGFVTCASVASANASALDDNLSDPSNQKWPLDPQSILLPQLSPSILTRVGGTLENSSDIDGIFGLLFPCGCSQQIKKFNWPKRSKIGVKPFEDCVSLLKSRIMNSFPGPQLHHFTAACTQPNDALPNSTRYFMCLGYSQPVCLKWERLQYPLELFLRDENHGKDDILPVAETLLHPFASEYFGVSQRCISVVSRYPFFEFHEKVLRAIYEICIAPLIYQELDDIANLSLHTMRLQRSQKEEIMSRISIESVESGKKFQKARAKLSSLNLGQILSKRKSTNETDQRANQVSDTSSPSGCSAWQVWASLISDWSLDAAVEEQRSLWEPLSSWIYSRVMQVNCPAAGEKISVAADIFKQTFSRIRHIEWLRPLRTTSIDDVLSDISLAHANPLMRRVCVAFQEKFLHEETVGLPLATEEANSLIQYHCLEHILDVVPVEYILVLLRALLTEYTVVITGRGWDLSKGIRLIKHSPSQKDHPKMVNSDDFPVPSEWKQERYLVSSLVLLLQSMMSPLRWIGPALPMIPPDCEGLLSSPVAILVGIQFGNRELFSTLGNRSLVFDLHSCTIYRPLGDKLCNYSPGYRRSIDLKLPRESRLCRNLDDKLKEIKMYGRRGKIEAMKPYYESLYQFSTIVREYIFSLLIELYAMVGPDLVRHSDQRERLLENKLIERGRSSEIRFWYQFLNTQAMESFVSVLKENLT